MEITRKVKNNPKRFLGWFEIRDEAEVKLRFKKVRKRLKGGNIEVKLR